jgi:Tol biopolymer transport system component
MENHSITLSRRFTLACFVILVVTISLVSARLLGNRRRAGDTSNLSASTQMDSKSQEVTARDEPKVHKICFLRGEWVYLANLLTGQETQIVEGLDPALSPTGEAIIFISVKESEGIMNRIFPPPGRLKLLDLRTKEIREFKTLSDKRIGDPIWSNGGSKIAVTMSSTTREGSSIALLDPYTGALEKEIISTEMASNEPIYLDSWTPGDRSVLFHTLAALYELQVDNGHVEKVPVDDIFKSGAISSATHFGFSSDRRSLLFDRIIDTPKEPATNVIFLFDIPTKTVRRVTPEGINGRAAVWLPLDKGILFSRVQWRQEKWQSDICKMALDGTGLTTVVRDADFVSYTNR